MDFSKEDIRKHLDSSANEKERIDLLNHYAYKVILKDYELARKLSEEALSLSEKAQYMKGRALCLLNMGIIAYNQCDFSLMEEYLQEFEALLEMLPEPEREGQDRLYNIKACYLYNQGNYSQALDLYEKALYFARIAGDLDMFGRIYTNLSMIYHSLNLHRKALECCLESLNVLEASSDPSSRIVALNNAGSFCECLGEYKRGLSFLEEALQLAEQTGIKKHKPVILEGMASIYMRLGNIDKAEKLLEISLKSSHALKLNDTEVASMSKLGSLYLMTGRLEQAEEILLGARDKAEQTGRLNTLYEIHKYLKDLYMQKNDYQKACYHMEHYIKHINEKEEEEINVKMTNIEAEFLRQANQRIKIISSIGQKITSSLQLDMVLDVIYESINAIMEAAIFGIALVSEDKKQINYSLFVEEGARLDSICNNMDNKKSLAVLSVREKRDIFISDFKKELHYILPEAPSIDDTLFGKNMEKVPRSILCCPLMTSGEVTGVITVQSYKKNAYTISDLDSLKALASYVAIALKNASQSGLIREQNEKLSRINRQLEVMMMQVQEKNEQILSSIGYAKKIQSSILPSESIIKDFFAGCFLLYKPRDIVGGDLYWFRTDNRGLLCIIGDCTGHGIPGALMVMAVNTLLTKINDDSFYDNPSSLLTRMNSLLKNTLKQDNEYSGFLSDDGADLGVCFIPHDRKNLIFAGANLSLYYTSGNEVHQIKGDPVSIGYKSSNPGFTYTNHTLQLSDQSTYYMATDGYKDQIGGPRGFPLGYKNFRKLLASVHKMELDKQQVLLEEELAAYSRGEKQIDDITILGFKV